MLKRFRCRLAQSKWPKFPNSSHFISHFRCMPCRWGDFNLPFLSTAQHNRLLLAHSHAPHWSERAFSHMVIMGRAKNARAFDVCVCVFALEHAFLSALQLNARQAFRYSGIVYVEYRLEITCGSCIPPICGGTHIARDVRFGPLAIERPKNKEPNDIICAPTRMPTCMFALAINWWI